VARGGKPFDQQLRSLVDELGVASFVHLAGAVGRLQLAELLNAADVFTLPSFTEGCPNVVSEALACGAPVVATSVGAIPQMICSERYGLLVPPRDQEALDDALLYAVDSPWDRTAIAKHGGARRWSDVAREVAEALLPLARPVPSASGSSPKAAPSVAGPTIPFDTTGRDLTHPGTPHERL
jgi:glycosyltransferase involved in cell wall biosynthesis